MERVISGGSTLKGILIAGFTASLLLNWALWNQIILPKNHIIYNAEQQHYAGE